MRSGQPPETAGDSILRAGDIAARRPVLSRANAVEIPRETAYALPSAPLGGSGHARPPALDPDFARAFAAATARPVTDTAASALVPSWLQPFTMPSTNARFTRTPDYILRPDGDGRGREKRVRTRGDDDTAAPGEAAGYGETTSLPAASTEGPAVQGLPASADPVWTGVAKEAGAILAGMEPGPYDRHAAAAGDDAARPPVETALPDRILRLVDILRIGGAPDEAASEQDNVAGVPFPHAAEPPLPGAFTVRASFGWPMLGWPTLEGSRLDGSSSDAAGLGFGEPPVVEIPLIEMLPVGLPADEPEAAMASALDETTGGGLELAAWNDVASCEAEILPASEPVVMARPRAAPLRPSVGDYDLPSLALLAEPVLAAPATEHSEEALERSSVMLQQTLYDFGVRGEIIDASPGPVVTLFELEPAPGTKSSRVMGLSNDIARSMSAVSARVAVIQGRNVIGIELPNQQRETVFLREMLETQEFRLSKHRLAIALGKTIGGEPVIVDLARMPHLLVAGTTGSGKSVAINTMILSLLYLHRPEECRLIMVDPKMLELSVYDGIPHLLTPVVTDPKKAVVALKWAVREMEERYKKMSKLSVRNIDGFNARVAEAAARGEVVTRTVQTGFDRETGEAVYEDEVMDLAPLPYIVVIVDEMADLMMVAGKDIEGAIQRLAQMARAAGIHLIMATQRPSVDVITGTIKANFPTRISFQVTSKIDSRTILGEMGAEQLLGQGDMLYMAGGGRITRVHGPFVSDGEVEKVVAHLKAQGRPEYLDAVTVGDDEASAMSVNPASAAAADLDAAVFDKGAMGEAFAPEIGGDLYDQAVSVVLRDKKASTSYIQRRLGIGYNRAASIMERMETEGIVGQANHAGKREILLTSRPEPAAFG